MRDLRHHNHGKGPELPPIDAGKIGASMLIACGALLAFWVTAMVWIILFEAENLPLVERMAPKTAEVKTLTLPNEQTIIFPDAFVYFLAYLLAAAFVGISSRLSLAMITGGLKLLTDKPKEKQEIADHKAEAA
jgi:hypothetical protein